LIQNKKFSHALIQKPINPTIVSYNASAVKNYNAQNSLVRFENENTFF
jgi:hypothetical protein